MSKQSTPGKITPSINGLSGSYQYSGEIMTLCCGHAVMMAEIATENTRMRISQMPCT